MLQVLGTIVRTVVSCFQTHRSLALRHQVMILKRSAPKRPKLSASDRVLWGWLSRLWADWQKVLLIVKPETAIAWHKRGFRWFWTTKSRRGPGRPPIGKDVIQLIRSMSEANPLWGAPRIRGELRKVGICVAQSTVEKYMVKHRKPPSQTWRTFLDNHVKDLVSIDFFIVPTATFRVLFVMLILSHDLSCSHETRLPLSFGHDSSDSEPESTRECVPDGFFGRDSICKYRRDVTPPNLAPMLRTVGSTRPSGTKGRRWTWAVKADQISAKHSMERSLA